MERRHFLRIAVGFTAGAAALAASAQAAPLAPHTLEDNGRLPSGNDARPAVTSESEVDRLKPEQVRWGHHGHGHHRGWRRRHWRRWHRRHHW